MEKGIAFKAKRVQFRGYKQHVQVIKYMKIPNPFPKAIASSCILYARFRGNLNS